MGLEEKIANAKPTTFLTDGLTQEEVKQCVESGRKVTIDDEEAPTTPMRVVDIPGQENKIYVPIN